jgi:hypothetical protein
MQPVGMFMGTAPSKNWMGKNENFTDFKGEKMKNFADTSAFNAGVKEKNTKTNKITIVITFVSFVFFFCGI